MKTRRWISCVTGLKLSLVLSALFAACVVLHACAVAATTSIKRSEYVTFDGANLYLQIRGADRTAPVLLFLSMPHHFGFHCPKCGRFLRIAGITVALGLHFGACQ